MNFYKYFLIFIISIILMSLNVLCQVDTCWTLYFPHNTDNGYYNPDSVLYDSCACKDRIVLGCDGIYAKQWFEIIFNDKDPFGFPEFPEDTIFESTWQELDSSYIELRNMFQNFENIFGSFVLRKVYPHITDSNSIGSRRYIIKFQNYCNIGSVINYLTSGGFFYFVYYQNQCVRLTSDYKEPVLQKGQLSDDNYVIKNIKVKDNTKFYPYHKLSLQWGLYKMKTFLAWEISKGEPNTVICVHDGFEGNNNIEVDDIYHGTIKTSDNLRGGTEDLFLNTQTQTLGNINFYNGVSFGGIQPKKFAISNTSDPIVSHGTSVSSAIIPKLNDKGVVGVCPNCHTINEHYSYASILIDAIPNNEVFDHPPIVNRSYYAISDPIGADAFGPDLSASTTFSGYGMTNVTHPIIAAQYSNEILKSYLGDSKVLGVYAIKDGNWETGKTCINWDPRIEITTSNTFYNGSNIDPELLFKPATYEPTVESMKEQIRCEFCKTTKWKILFPCFIHLICLNFNLKIEYCLI